MNTTFEEKKATRDLVDKCKIYLNDNFHKFSQYNKIKISLAILARALPNEVEQHIVVTHMNDVEIGGRIKEFIVG